jgi:hypothetical protein
MTGVPHKGAELSLQRVPNAWGDPFSRHNIQEMNAAFSDLCFGKDR